MKKLSILLFLSTFTLSLMAVPAFRHPRQVTQPDGSVITVITHGDEHLNWLTDERGQRLERHADGFYRHAAAPMHVSSPKRAGGIRVIPPRILVVLTQFSDVSFRPENNVASYDSLFNSDNYIHNGATGSIRQYFYDQSLGQYNPQFDIVGPVTLSKSVTHYGENKKNGAGQDIPGKDLYAAEMVAEACTLADQQFGVDFSLYSNVLTGQVDAVYILYAGYGEANGGQPYTVWPHNYTLQLAGYTQPELDGKKVNAYVCSDELFNEYLYYGDGSQYVREGIGIMCHEFSHLMGLPDIYETNSKGYEHKVKTSGMWDLMDYGVYNNESRTPSGYTAYERWFMGWSTPLLLNEARNDTLRCLHQTGECRLITSTGEHNMNSMVPNPTDFYLLENRQRTGWDTYIPGHGMLATRVRYNTAAWSGNTVNNTKSLLRMDIIEADGLTPSLVLDEEGYTVLNGYDGKPGDCYPAGATEFIPYEQYPVTDIAEAANGIITYKFMGGVEEPEDPTGITPVFNNHQTIQTIYDMLGHSLTTDLDNLPHGIYIIKTNTNTYKLCK